MKYFVVRQQC